MLHLERITADNFDLIRPGLTEIKNNPTPYDIRAVKRMIEYMDKNFDGYLDYLQKNESPNQPEGRVPSTTLLLFDDDKFVGVYDVRHRLNEFLSQHGGHIAYHIVPSERQKGYVKAGLKLVLNWCYAHLNLDKALLFCDSTNHGSDRAMTSVMTEMGGTRVPEHEFEGGIERGVWINTRAVPVNRDKQHDR